MKRILSALLALAVLAALAIVTTTSKRTVPAVYAAPASPTCTLNGSYAMIQPAGLTTNNSSGNGSTQVPWQFAGVVTFYPDGSVAASWTAAVDGAISGGDQNNFQSAKGTYTVNTATCAGSLVLTQGQAAGLSANFFLAGGGAEIFGIMTNPGNTATFDAKKQ